MPFKDLTDDEIWDLMPKAPIWMDDQDAGAWEAGWRAGFRAAIEHAEKEVETLIDEAERRMDGDA
jgi:hypothetical protein